VWSEKRETCNKMSIKKQINGKHESQILMCIWLMISFFVLLFAIPPANANELTSQTCGIILKNDVAYIEQRLEDDGGNSLVSPEIGGPVDLVMADLFKTLDKAYIPRLKRGYTLEFVRFCNENSSMIVADAISELSRKLNLDMSTENWGMKAINTDKLLESSCQDFVSFIQEFGVADMFYNDPVKAAFADYWARYYSENVDVNIRKTMEGDAQLACSWEPQSRLINVLDEVARDYELRRLK